MRTFLLLTLFVLVVLSHLILALGGDAPPTVTTTPATNIGASFATLNGTVNPNGLPTNARFDYGPTTVYTDSTPLIPVSIASQPVPITYNISGLSPTTQYHFRARATNVDGTGYGLDQTLTTLPAIPPSPPVLSFPPNGATNQLLTPTLSWNTSPGATAYQLQVSSDSIFTRVVLDDSALTVTSRQVGPLTTNRRYFWHVKARNQYGGSAYSTVWSFTTRGPLAPIVTTAAPTNVSHSSATLNGSVNPNGMTASARFEYGTTTTYGDSTPLIPVSTASPPVPIAFNIGSLVQSTLYHFRARATNAEGTGYGLDQGFVTSLAPPPPPDLLSPPNGGTGVSITPTLAWNPSAGATSYRLQVATDSLFANLVVDNSAITTTSSVVGPLNYLTRYFWHVRAQNSGGNSTYSTRWSFTTVALQLPSQVVLVAPPHGASINTDSVLAIWEQSQPQVTRYWFEMSLDSPFTFTSIDSTRIDTSKIVRQLLNNTTYWWRARANNPTGWGSFSVARRFRVVLTNVIGRDEIPHVFSLKQNYPNPFNPTTVIRYDIPKTTTVRLVVFNTLGQVVAELVRGSQVAGIYNVPFNGEGLPSGVYLCRLEASEFNQTRKLLLLR
ncbi:MAG: Por secretion system C-terminal sorting protein [Bacteroidetes bacterium]|nr:Por secretion system C-terminal sorting protein [Bacteroidota bacterium]